MNYLSKFMDLIRLLMAFIWKMITGLLVWKSKKGKDKDKILQLPTNPIIEQIQKSNSPQHHPDKNKEQGSEKTLKEPLEADEVLIDKDQGRNYDFHQQEEETKKKEEASNASRTSFFFNFAFNVHISKVECLKIPFLSAPQRQS